MWSWQSSSLHAIWNVFCLFHREQFGIFISNFGIHITTVGMSDLNAENEVIAYAGCYRKVKSYLQYFLNIFNHNHI